MEGEKADSPAGARWGGICSSTRPRLPRTHGPPDKVHHPLSARPQPAPGLGAGLAHPPPRFRGAGSALAAAPRPAAGPAAEAWREPPAQVGHRERGGTTGGGSGGGGGSAAGTPARRMLEWHGETR